jgi:hypothetical protein
VLVHGAGGPGAFDRPSSQQIEIPDSSYSGLRVGEANQEQRLNEAKECPSHDDHSTKLHDRGSKTRKAHHGSLLAD